jgi:hypothetical protein
MRVYVFTCNAERCHADTGEITPPNADDGARSAWRVAKAEGWIPRGLDRHYCPDHRGDDAHASVAIDRAARAPLGETLQG